MAAFQAGDPAAMGQALDDHISAEAHAVDYGGIIEQRRAELDQAHPLPRRVRARDRWQRGRQGLQTTANSTDHR
jgi:hypothetical protein